jgi:hypothetical protein
MPETSITIPPETGTEPPNGDDPEPLGTTVTPLDDANRTIAETASADFARTTASGTELNMICRRKRGISDWSRE